jgi:DNA primase
MIDFDSFVRWAEDKFGDVIVKGNEVKINSIFAEDTKHHLWCSPSGGKHDREDGCYRCFYTERKGTLVGLVMFVEQCSYQEAKEILSGQSNIKLLEEKLDKIFEEGSFKSKPENKLKLPDNCYLISEIPLTSLYRIEAENYLQKRKLPINDLYYCISGEYRNRIIIPYYDDSQKLIYWNSRHLTKKPRYLGPDKSVGIGKGNVLYAPKWAPKGNKVYITEGEFDALTLFVSGFYGIACGGKTLSDDQLEIIRSKEYKVCLGPDNDRKVIEAASPGRLGMIEMAKKLFSAFIPVTYIFPPTGFKDWNEMLVSFKPEIVAEYIKKTEKILDPLVIEQLMCLV